MSSRLSSAASSSSSASAIVVGSTSGYHVLKIEGYSLTKSVPNGKHIQSRTFRVAGHNWVIHYYPNGDRTESADYVSLFLVLKDRITDALTVHLSLSFIDQVDRQKPSYVRGIKANSFLRSGSGFGQIKFVKRNDLERSGRLKRDCFTVRCDMIVVGKAQAVNLDHIPTAPAAVLVQVPPPNWPDHFLALLQSGQGADVRFLVDGSTFAAHRCVLAARSPVFAAELYGGMKESAGGTAHPVQVDDMRADVFRNLLHFIYTDTLPPEMTAVAETDDGGAASSMVQHLLVAADRYDMERLKVICEDKLCRLVDVSSAGTILLLAEQHRCRRLKEACFEFLTTLKKLDVAGRRNRWLPESCKNFPFVLFRSNCQAWGQCLMIRKTIK